MNGQAETDDLRSDAPVIVVHTAFRREFRLVGDAVRRTAAGDTGRAAVVAEHVALLLRLLEHHHRLEDELVWPRLRNRVSDHAVPVVEHMAAQHADLASRLERVAELLPTWARTAATDDREDLALSLDILHDELVEHLDDEERDLLTLAVEHLTATEWHEIGRRAEAAHDRRDRALVLGMLQYEGDPDVVASMLAHAPLPARVLAPLLARRAFRRHALVVHGTPTP